MENSNETSSKKDHNSTNLNLIYEDAGNSLEFARNNVEAINSRFVFLLGFNAAFVRLSMDLPDQHSCEALYCYSCQWLKALTFFSLLGSIAITLWGIYPTEVRLILLPTFQLAKKDAPEGKFREEIIKAREGMIKSFAHLSDKKSTRLKAALTLLGLAASLSAIDLTIKLLCY